MTRAAVRVEAAGATSPGRIREHNEDSHLAAAPLFLVADGLGGHAHGEAASRAVTAAFAHLVGQERVTPEDLLRTVDEASRSVAALAASGGAPGSTLSGVALAAHAGTPCWLVFNVGDSRTYLLEDGRLDQLTVDHSAVVHSPEAGSSTRNVITRAIGAGTRRAPITDHWLVPIRPGHRVLVCSDGLTNELTNQLILACLLSEPDPRSAAQRLVQAAVEAGGRDNVTVVVVDAVAVEAAPAPEQSADTVPDTVEPGMPGLEMRLS